MVTQEDVKLCLNDSQESMEKALQHSVSELSKIRAGKANPEMLNGIEVDYYGTKTPIQQVSNINTPDAKNIVIQPWEKGMLKIIEQAIKDSNMGLSPQNNGEHIRITLPPLTEERRKEFVKSAKQIAEHGKVAIRNLRKDANDFIKDLKNEGLSEDDFKNAESQVQKLTDTYIEKTEQLFLKKEKDILTL